MVRSLLYLARAGRDLEEIFDYIADASGSPVTARRFVAAIEAHCQKLARLPGAVGRPRPELGEDVRSSAFGGYVVFFRYLSADRIEIVAILSASRDVAPISFREGPEPRG